MGGRHPFKGSGRQDIDRGRARRSRWHEPIEAAVGPCAPVRPDLVMTLPRTVADVLSRHVTFEIESIHRIYLNGYQPWLVPDLAHDHRS